MGINFDNNYSSGYNPPNNWGIYSAGNSYSSTTSAISSIPNYFSSNNYSTGNEWGTFSTWNNNNNSAASTYSNNWSSHNWGVSGDNAGSVIDGGYAAWNNQFGTSIFKPATSGNTVSSSSTTATSQMPETEVPSYDYSGQATALAETKQQVSTQKAEIESKQSELQAKIDTATAALEDPKAEDNTELAAIKRSLKDNPKLRERMVAEQTRLNQEMTALTEELKSINETAGETEKAIATLQGEITKEYEALQGKRTELLASIADLNSCRKADREAPTVNGITLSKPEETAALEKTLLAQIKAQSQAYQAFLSQASTAQKTLGLKPPEGQAPMMKMNAFKVGLHTKEPKAPIVDELTGLVQNLTDAICAPQAGQTFTLDLAPYKLDGGLEAGFTFTNTNKDTGYTVKMTVVEGKLKVTDYTGQSKSLELDIDTVANDFKAFNTEFKQLIATEKAKPKS